MISGLADRVSNELRVLLTPGRRMADELECVASVLLAIVLAHLIGAKMIAWAAFSAFVLLKGAMSETLLRGVLRMIGTLLGATLAIWFVRLSPGVQLPAGLAVTMLVTAMVGGLGLYGTLTAHRSYAWLLFGLTFVMILLDKLQQPGIDVQALAVTRVLEVGAGTVACVAVSLVSTLTARRWWPVPPSAGAQHVGWHPDAARHAAQAGVAVGLLPLLNHIVAIPELAQAGVTVMAVMIVPVAGLGSSGLVPVGRRLRHRALGCLAGGVLASLVLLIAGGSVPVLVTGTCLGIIVGRHIENGGPARAYLGLQFTLAVLIVLIPDDYANVAIEPGLKRFLSVFIGMAVLVPILLAGYFLVPERKAADAATDSGASE